MFVSHTGSCVRTVMHRVTDQCIMQILDCLPPSIVRVLYVRRATRTTEACGAHIRRPNCSGGVYVTIIQHEQTNHHRYLSLGLLLLLLGQYSTLNVHHPFVLSFFPSLERTAPLLRDDRKTRPVRGVLLLSAKKKKKAGPCWYGLENNE